MFDPLDVIKKKIFEEALTEGEVAIVFDGEAPGVVLPDSVDRRDGVVLNYGLAMPKPIPDLEVREDGISATLSFDNMPHSTFVPWRAVAGLRSSRGITAFAGGVAFPLPTPAPPKGKPKLKLVD